MAVQDQRAKKIKKFSPRDSAQVSTIDSAPQRQFPKVSKSDDCSFPISVSALALMSQPAFPRDFPLPPCPNIEHQCCVSISGRLPVLCAQLRSSPERDMETESLLIGRQTHSMIHTVLAIHILRPPPSAENHLALPCCAVLGKGSSCWGHGARGTCWPVIIPHENTLGKTTALSQAISLQSTAGQLHSTRVFPLEILCKSFDL